MNKTKLEPEMDSNIITVGIAESCTGGNIQKIITKSSGVSQWFMGGVTTYNIVSKVNILGVDYNTADKCDCVSDEVSIQMAKGIATLFDSNIGISTTGYVHANNPLEKEPVMYVGYYFNNVISYKKFIIPLEDNSREDIQVKMAKEALRYFKEKYLDKDDTLRIHPNYKHLRNTFRTAIQ